MKKIVLVMMLLTGCAASFQPFGPQVTKADFDQTNENVMAIAQALNKMQAVMITKVPEKQEKK